MHGWSFNEVRRPWDVKLDGDIRGIKSRIPHSMAAFSLRGFVFAVDFK